MPELGEVELARSLLQKLENQTVNITQFEDSIVHQNNISSPIFIKSVDRYGKYLYITCDGDQKTIVLHLGMTGQILVHGEPSLIEYESRIKYDPTIWPPLYCKLLFEGSHRIAFVDPRRLGRTWVLGSSFETQFAHKLGFDPILSMPTFPEFNELIKKRKGNIKSLLLDQTFCAGLGNWMADEILFQSGIHPQLKIIELETDEIQNIYDKVKYISKRAFEIKDLGHAFPADWLFHDRWGKGKRGPSFQNRKIEFIKIGGRTTALVPAAQKKKLAKVSKKQK